MKMGTVKGSINVDMKKFRYAVICECWNHIEWVVVVTKRTNDIKAAQRELKRMQAKCDELLDGHEHWRNVQIIES